MDEAIAQMVAFTDTSPERAAQYLQLADGDVNQAVSLFFESNGADLSAQFSTPSTSAAPAAPSLVSGAGNAQNPIQIEDENISDDNDPHITNFRKPSRPAAPRHGDGEDYEDDETMARRLQEEMYGAGGPEASVRAPIARQAETLLGPSSNFYPGPALDDAVQERMQAFQNRRARRGPGIFNQQPTSRIWNEGGTDRAALSESTGGASDINSRTGYLARLFQPPWDLMFKGSWEEARDEGKAEKKWLLVNIQNEKVFDCQVLNRDIWKNEGIVDTIQAQFLFLQYSKDDPRAEQYCNYYFSNFDVEDEYPHIAVVDPRTGEQVKLWSKKVPGAADFLIQLHEFLDRYSLETHARNPVAKRKSESRKEKPVEMLTEDEQLERALQASMAGQEEGLNVPDEDPDDLTRSIGDLKGKQTAGAVEDEAMDMEENGNSPALSAFASISSDRPHSEPAAGPDVTRIQLRHPAGRIVRRFAVSDPVQRIYEYLKAEPLEGREGAEFELMSMGKNLIGSVQETVQAAGLKNGTVMVEFVES